MYCGVPASVLALSLISRVLALPKSVRITCPCSESIQFSGFRSLERGGEKGRGREGEGEREGGEGEGEGRERERGRGRRGGRGV